GPPTLVTARFDLDEPQTGINGIRIIGPEGGTASGGFIGIFELAVLREGTSGGGGDGPTVVVERSDAGITVTWNSVSGTSYRLERSADLKTWATAQDDIDAGAGSSTSVTVTNEGEEAAFFRIVVLP